MSLFTVSVWRSEPESVDKLNDVASGTVGDGFILGSAKCLSHKAWVSSVL